MTAPARKSYLSTLRPKFQGSNPRTIVTLVETVKDGNLIKARVKDEDGNEFVLTPRIKEDGSPDNFNQFAIPGTTWQVTNLADTGNGEKSFKFIESINLHPLVNKTITVPVVSFSHGISEGADKKPRPWATLTAANPNESYPIKAGATVEEIKASVSKALEATDSLVPNEGFETVFDDSNRAVVLTVKHPDGLVEAVVRPIGVVKEEDGSYRIRTMDEYFDEAFVEALSGIAAAEAGLEARVYPAVRLNTSSLVMFGNSDGQAIEGEGKWRGFKFGEGTRQNGESYIRFGAIKNVKLVLRPNVDTEKLQAILTANNLQPSLFVTNAGDFASAKAMDHLAQSNIDFSEALTGRGSVSNVVLSQHPDYTKAAPIGYALSGTEYKPEVAARADVSTDHEDGHEMADAGINGTDASLAASIDDAINGAMPDLGM